MKTIAIILALLVCATTAHAAVHRCNVNGKIVYTDSPCNNAAPVDTTNATPPSAKDAAEAKSRAEKDRAEVAKIEAKRDREEEIASNKRIQNMKEAEEHRKHCRKLERRVREMELAAKTARSNRDSAALRLKHARENFDEDCGN